MRTVFHGMQLCAVGLVIATSVASCGSTPAVSSVSASPAGSFKTTLLRYRDLPKPPASLRKTLPYPGEEYHQLYRHYAAAMETSAANGDTYGCYPPKQYARLHWREGLVQWITEAVEHGGQVDEWHLCAYRFATTADASEAYQIGARELQQTVKDGSSTTLRPAPGTGAVAIGVSVFQGPRQSPLWEEIFDKGKIVLVVSCNVQILTTYTAGDFTRLVQRVSVRAR